MGTSRSEVLTGHRPALIDVAIVGGGPAGLLVAARCADAGLDVLVLEEHALIGEPTHCTGIISLETTELVKVPDDLILKFLDHARFHSPNGRSCEIGWEGNKRERVLVIDRGAFDRNLAEQAAEAGADIRGGVRVDSVSVDEDGVALAAGPQIMRARTCVLACGVSYRLQRQLGLALPRRVIHTAQVEVDAEPAEGVDLYFGRSLARDGFAWVTPVSRGPCDRVKIGVIATGDAGAALETFLARSDVLSRLRARPGIPLRRLLPLEPLARTYTRRVLVVGDAGGFTKPTTGGGIFYSLLTASLAADTLIEAFQEGRFDEGILRRYERRWRQRLGDELRVAAWLRRLVTKLRDAEIDALLAALGTDDAKAAIRATGRFNWHRNLILTLVRRRGLAGLLIRALFR